MTVTWRSEMVGWQRDILLNVTVTLQSIMHDRIDTEYPVECRNYPELVMIRGSTNLGSEISVP